MNCLNCLQCVQGFNEINTTCSYLSLANFVHASELRKTVTVFFLPPYHAKTMSSSKCVAGTILRNS